MGQAHSFKIEADRQALTCNQLKHAPNSTPLESASRHDHNGESRRQAFLSEGSTVYEHNIIPNPNMGKHAQKQIIKDAKFIFKVCSYKYKAFDAKDPFANKTLEECIEEVVETEYRSVHHRGSRKALICISELELGETTQAKRFGQFERYPDSLL